VFPPLTIILPPPVPVTYAQTDLSATWINESSLSPDGNSAICYNIRGDFQDSNGLTYSSGSFCHFEELWIVKDPDNFTQVETVIRAWTGTWDKGYINLVSGGRTLTGQILQGFPIVMVLTDNDGRQLRIVQSSDFFVETLNSFCE